jgi:hypothetical protein
MKVYKGIVTFTFEIHMIRCLGWKMVKWSN